MAQAVRIAFAFGALFSCYRFVGSEEVMMIALNFEGLRHDPPSSPPQPTPAAERTPEKCDQPCAHCWGTGSPNDMACDVGQLLSDNIWNKEKPPWLLTLSYPHPSRPNTTCSVTVYKMGDEQRYVYNGGFCDQDVEDEVQPPFLVKDLDEFTTEAWTSSSEVCSYKLERAGGRELGDVWQVKFHISTHSCEERIGYLKDDPKAAIFRRNGRYHPSKYLNLFFP